MSQSNASVGSMNGRESMISSEMRKGLVTEMLVPPPRSLHSMETVHTPDHRGFLGVPKTSNLSSGEMERARQVDRLGARLTRMLSKTNYVESRNARVHDQDEFEAGDFRQGPSATTASTSAEAQKTKWVKARASLRPPPSPKMPSESWLSNTLPPERLLLVKKLSRKPLGSFIPINPLVKPTSEQPNCEVRFKLFHDLDIWNHSRVARDWGYCCIQNPLSFITYSFHWFVVSRPQFLNLDSLHRKCGAWCWQVWYCCCWLAGRNYSA